jgi:hypothetical protein
VVWNLIKLQNIPKDNIMGQVKDEWMEAESKGYKLPREKYVCANHFDDIYLKQYIKEHSKLGICDYCKKSKLVIDFRDFMEYTADKIQSHFGDPGDEALYLASSFYDSDDERIPGFKRVGCYIAPSYADNYESTKELLYDINLQTDNEELNKDIEDCFLGDEWIQRAPYVMSKRQELSFMWQMFEKMVKHEQRFTFFKNPEFKENKLSDENGLLDILTEIGAILSKHKLCKEIDTGLELYRCRFVDGEIVDGFDKITSPPDNKAKQSRMSPAGVSMFYGAFDKKTAVLESSPNGKGIGKYVLGKFKTKRKLKILDFTSLPQSSFWMHSDWEGIEFLHSFYREITKPIERDDHIHIEYVPSQVFTEYLRYIYTPCKGENLDGIIYKSSLVGAQKNIVLFFNQHYSSDILEVLDIT